MQETVAIFAEYTNVALLTASLAADADDAERQQRRRIPSGSSSSSGDLFNQSEWFHSKLRQLANDTLGTVLPEDDDNHAMQETVDSDMKSAFQTFGNYLAQKYMALQTAIVRDELVDAADMAALVLPEASVRQIADAAINTLNDRETLMKVGDSGRGRVCVSHVARCRRTQICSTPHTRRTTHRASRPTALSSSIWSAGPTHR